ncbi:hypothetical protein K474DRAFT_1342907 [Panus rudis PR-1116 ss-1]|nr:hypothetical protein K474DRAFT_1342907 [Panus rudis PR-1116 ss-1]
MERSHTDIWSHALWDDAIRRFGGSSSGIDTSVAEAFQCLRLWVISGRDWKATTIVFVINWVPPLLDLYNQVHNHTSTMVPSGPLAGCYTIPTPSAPTYPIGAISRAATMLSDAIILYVTVMSSVHAYRSRSTEVPSTKTMLYQLLLRNGVTQFITLFMINVVALFIEIYVLTSGLNTDSNVLCIVDGISAIIICRFLLDLRAIYPATTTDQIGRSDSTHTSGIRFAKSFIGNIGAPTRQTMSWVSSAEEIDRLEAEVPVYSNESLRFIASDYTTDTEVEMRNMGSRHA